MQGNSHSNVTQPYTFHWKPRFVHQSRLVRCHMVYQSMNLARLAVNNHAYTICLLFCLQFRTSKILLRRHFSSSFGYNWCFYRDPRNTCFFLCLVSNLHRIFLFLFPRSSMFRIYEIYWYFYMSLVCNLDKVYSSANLHCILGFHPLASLIRLPRTSI